MKKEMNGIDLQISNIAENRKEQTSAYFDNLTMTSQQAKALAKALAKNTHLTYINLFGTRLTTSDLLTLKAPIKASKITEVILEHNTLDKDYEKVVAEILDIVEANKKGDSSEQSMTK